MLGAGASGRALSSSKWAVVPFLPAGRPDNQTLFFSDFLVHFISSSLPTKKKERNNFLVSLYRRIIFNFPFSNYY